MGQVVELGWSETNRTRNAAVRINGSSSSRVPVAMTMHSGAVAPSASTADNGYEDGFSLASNMYSIQRNAGDYVLYHNLGGSIESTTLGGAEADTLQTVTERGNTTNTSIISTGPYISGGTGYFTDLHVEHGNTLTEDLVTIKGGGSAGDYDVFKVQAANGDDLFRVGGFSYDVIIPDSDTNVGIGITNPSKKLHVVGTARISSHTDLQSTVDISSTTRIYDKLGIGAGSSWVNPANGIDVYGSVAIGASYIGASAPSNGAIIQGNVGIGTSSASNALDVNGHLSATSKSFLIDHPIEENKKLQYACLEGPENGVYVRGTTNSASIELPDYWSELIHEDSITVIVTPIGKKQDLYIKSKSPQLIMIGGVKGSYDYVVYGERKDIDRLEIEPLKV